MVLLPRSAVARGLDATRPHSLPLCGQVLSRAMPAMTADDVQGSPGGGRATGRGAYRVPADDPNGICKKQMNTVRKADTQIRFNRGSCEMRMMNKAGWLGLAALALAGVVPAGQVRAEAAAGPSKELVNAVINYAWAMLPAQFSSWDGKVVSVDKSKRDVVMVPDDVAQEVVRVARISAHAQVCNLPELQSLNHRSLMKRETEKKTWTDQQKLWINQLHLTTVMLLTGKIKAVETEGGKEVAVVETKEPPNTCTEEQKQAVTAKINDYVKNGPKLPAVAPWTAAQQAAGQAAPAAAGQAAPVAGAAAPVATGSTPAPAADATPVTKPASPLPATAVAPPAASAEKK